MTQMISFQRQPNRSKVYGENTQPEEDMSTMTEGASMKTQEFLFQSPNYDDIVFLIIQ